MVRILSVASLALAVVSAVSGHVIRHRLPPKGWETPILESYDVYHTRYLDFKCYEKHNTTFFDKCCHPLLKGEPLSVLYDLECFSTAHDGDDCDDGDSSIPPTPTSYSPAVKSSSPDHNTPTSSPPVYSPESPQPTSSPPVHTTSFAAQPKVAVPDSVKTSSTPETTHTKATSPSPSPTSNDGDFIFGGFATFFYQNDNPGACGEKHSDNDLIAAIDERRYGNSGNASPLCGKKVEIINTKNDKSVVVTIEDDCPTCQNSNSIDLSVAAFKKLAGLDEGLIDIKWRFVS